MAYPLAERLGAEARRPNPLNRIQPRRILLFHMGGVLGHLHRVLALAEEIDAAGHEAVVATSDGDLPIFRALRPGVRLAGAYDDPRLKAARTYIASPAEGRRSDRLNLRGMGPKDQAGKVELARQMERMAQADRALVERVGPDAIVLDHRFTSWPVLRDYRDRIFHISPLLGLPSLHQRATGRLPYPLEEAPLLVPGIRQIECWRRKVPSPAGRARVELCGLFRWQGWARLRGAQPVLPPADALFFFGSTGEAGKAVPALRRAASGRLSARWVGESWCGAGQDSREPAVDLESGLASADVLICHGGHGTVMEALFHQRPVIVLPSNPEQLEIGRRLEKMGLGLLVPQPIETIGGAELADLVARVKGDMVMRRRVEQYSALLRREADGAKRAAAIVLRNAGARLRPLEATKQG